MAKYCEACMKQLDPTKALKCSSCDVFYHELCLGIHLKDLKKSQIAAWTCPACCKKLPKNDNTPIRSDASPTDNITMRKRPASDECKICLSRDELTDIVRKEIRNAVNESMKVSIQACITAQFKEIKNQICELETSLAFINDQYEDFKKDIVSVKPQIQALTDENAQLKSSVSELSNRLAQMEQLTRASNVEIQCVPEHSGENLLRLVQQLGTVIEHPVQESEIIQCSRIAKLNPSNPRPRSILVKFTSPRLRECFLASSRRYNKEHPSDRLNSSHLGIADESKPNIFIVEHLSREAKALHMAARLRARETGYSIVWVRNGRVYLRKSEGGQYVWVKDMEVLKNLK